MLLIACAPPCAAQADDCTATVKIVSVGVQNPDGSTSTATEPGSLRIRGGKGQDFGEVGDKRSLPRMVWSAEDISCKRCLLRRAPCAALQIPLSAIRARPWPFLR